MIKYFHNETSYKFLSAPIQLNQCQLAISSIGTMAHTKAITVLDETYSLHMNKTDIWRQTAAVLPKAIYKFF